MPGDAGHSRSTDSERPLGHRKRERSERRSVSDERWEMILAAAADVFFKKGYEVATISDVAAAAGIRGASLYYYIDSKEDLLFALTERVHVDGLAYLDDPLLQEGDAKARLARFVDLWVARLEQDRHWSLLVEREFRTLSEARLASVVEKRRAHESILRGIIQLGIDQGAFDASTDPTVATQVIFQLLNYTTLWHRPDGPLSFSAVGAWERHFILKGLAPDHPPTTRPQRSARSVRSGK
jgi:AcrR family transcriptional regulator